MLYQVSRASKVILLSSFFFFLSCGTGSAEADFVSPLEEVDAPEDVPLEEDLEELKKEISYQRSQNSLIGKEEV